MGRHHEVRAAAMARTGKIKSALYARASREAYMAARTGSPDPKQIRKNFRDLLRDFWDAHTMSFREEDVNTR